MNPIFIGILDIRAEERGSASALDTLGILFNNSTIFSYKFIRNSFHPNLFLMPKLTQYPPVHLYFLFNLIGAFKELAINLTFRNFSSFSFLKIPKNLLNYSGFIIINQIIISKISCLIEWTFLCSIGRISFL